MTRSRFLVRVGGAAAALLLLAACGSGQHPTGGNSPGSRSATATGYPVSIRSTVGTATIPQRPERVVTLGWGSDDAALALGVAPVGMSINLPEAKDGITPWARAKLHGHRPVMLDDSDAIPYEKIAALHPDVILAVYSGVTTQQYKTLSDIAPTVGYPRKAWSTSWQDQLMIVGKALGRQAQAAALRTQVQHSITTTAAAHPEFRGKTAIFGSGTTPGSYNLYPRSDPRMQLLAALGFTTSDAAITTFPHGAGSPSFATTISLEQLPRLRTDVLIAWYLSAETRTSIEKQPVFGELAAVHDKAYLPITDPALVFATSAPNVLSIPWMLHTYVPLLSKVANAAGASR